MRATSSSSTIEDAINPSSAGNAYSITLLGNVTGPPAVSPFPDAGVTYPNGAIISFFGKDYVFAGGSAFEVQGPSELAALQRVDHAQVQSARPGAHAPTGAPRMGTLLFSGPSTARPPFTLLAGTASCTGSPRPGSSWAMATIRLSW